LLKSILAEGQDIMPVSLQLIIANVHFVNGYSSINQGVLRLCYETEINTTLQKSNSQQ